MKTKKKINFSPRNFVLPECNRLSNSYSQLKSKVDNILAKATALRINLNNIDGTHIASRTHTHPSHSQTSCLLFTSLSLGIPFPRFT